MDGDGDEQEIDIGLLLRAAKEAIECMEEEDGEEEKAVDEAVERTWEAMETGLQALIEEVEPISEQLAEAVEVYKPALKEWRRFWKSLSEEARRTVTVGAFERLDISHDLFVTLIPRGTLDRLSSVVGMPMLVGGAMLGRGLSLLNTYFNVKSEQGKDDPLLIVLRAYLVRALSSSVLYLSTEWEPPYCDPSHLSAHDQARRDLFRRALSLPTSEAEEEDATGGCVGVITVGVVTLVVVAFVMFVWDAVVVGVSVGSR